MHTVYDYLMLFALISFLLTITGLIRPGWILRWAKRHPRLRALGMFGGIYLSIALVASATVKPVTRPSRVEQHPVVREKIPAVIQPALLQTSKVDMGSKAPKGAMNKTQVGANEDALLQFLRKAGFKKEKSLYLHHADASHPLRPYIAFAYRYDSKGLQFFQLDNWYSDPVAAATLPASINMQLESIENSLLAELLGPALGNKLASIRSQLIAVNSGDVFSMALNGRILFGFITTGGGSIVFMDDDSPLGKGKYRKTPKRIT